MHLPITTGDGLINLLQKPTSELKSSQEQNSFGLYCTTR